MINIIGRILKPDNISDGTGNLLVEFSVKCERAKAEAGITARTMLSDFGVLKCPMVDVGRAERLMPMGISRSDCTWLYAHT